jgi:hypothetical protein
LLPSCGGTTDSIHVNNIKKLSIITNMNLNFVAAIVEEMKSMMGGTKIKV